jgi:predicted permease
MITPAPPSSKRALRRKGNVFPFPTTLVVLFLLTVIALLVSFFVVSNGPENSYGFEMAANVTAENGLEEMATLDSTVASISLRATAQLFVAVSLGVLVARNGGILNGETVKGLSKLTYCMFQPALIFCSVSKTLQSESAGAQGLSSLAIIVLPIVALLQIACGYATGRLLTRIFRMPSQADTRDVWMCTTFANSAPLPLVFADSLFADSLSMQADITACISFYLLVWSPVFWTVGPLILQSAPERRELEDVELDELEGSEGSKNYKETANVSNSVPEGRQHCTTEQIVRKILAPPVIGSIMGVVVGTSPMLQALFLQSDGLGAPMYGAAKTFASAYLPATILILAGSMGAAGNSNDDRNERPAELFGDAGKRKPMSPDGTSRRLSWRAVFCIAVARFVINPILTGVILNVLSTRTNLLGLPDSRTSAVLSFVILMQGCMPPAQNSVVMLQLENQKARATRMTTLLTVLYCMACVPVTFHISRSLAATGVTTFVGEDH